MGEATWASTPAAPTMATIQKWVAGYVGAQDDEEGLEAALAGIHLAIDRINARDWNWALVYEDIVFDVTLADYALPSNFKKPRRLLLLDATNASVCRLPFKPWQAFLDEHADSRGSGSPIVYSCANVREYGTISLDKMPSAEWVAKYPVGRLWYFRNVQRSNADGQPDWPAIWTPFVVASAENFVADRYAPQKSSAAYARAQAAWQLAAGDDAENYTDWE